MFEIGLPSVWCTENDQWENMRVLMKSMIAMLSTQLNFHPCWLWQSQRSNLCKFLSLRCQKKKLIYILNLCKIVHYANPILWNRYESDRSDWGGKAKEAISYGRKKKINAQGWKEEYFSSGAAGKVFKSPTSCFCFSALCLTCLEIKQHRESFYTKCSY